MHMRRLYESLTGGLFLAALPLLALACESTVVDVKAYDQSCAAASDCVAVIDGDVCCGCPNAAINKVDLDRYHADLGECSEQCDIFCAEVAVSCEDGTCMVAEAEKLCEPGAKVFCACVGGGQGSKTCDETGQAFGECSCG
jgi:hypothetical protein